MTIPQEEGQAAAGFQLVEDDFPPLPPPSPIQNSVQPQEENTHTMVTRAKAGVRKTNPRYVHTVKSEVAKPKNLAEALSHPGWTAAMVDDHDTCQETRTWSIVPHPSNANILGWGWVHKIKLNTDGTVEKLHSRLVARGNE